jgi:hypothetical protein
MQSWIWRGQKDAIEHALACAGRHLGDGAIESDGPRQSSRRFRRPLQSETGLGLLQGRFFSSPSAVAAEQRS